jgi:hypothetical protein
LPFTRPRNRVWLWCEHGRRRVPARGRVRCSGRRSSDNGVVRPHRQPRLQADRRRPALDVRGRRRFLIVHERAPLSEPGCRSATRRSAGRGADQLLPLSLPGTGEPSDFDHQRSRRLPVGPGTQARVAGLRTKSTQQRDIAGRKIVLLVDVSGSMSPPERLPPSRRAAYVRCAASRAPSGVVCKLSPGALPIKPSALSESRIGSVVCAVERGRIFR